MKILVLGATGRTGKFLVEYALKKGYHVNCLVRDSSRIQSVPDLTIFQGNPINKEDLSKAIKGCSAVVSALNISRTSDFPWAKLRTPNTYLSDVITNILVLATKHELNRIVVCSAWGVLETEKDIPFWFRWMINNSNIGAAYKDHERQEKLLESSDANWTIVRPVGLSNSKSHQDVRESFNNQPKPSLLIGRRLVAKYMIDSIENPQLIGKKVVISKA